MKLKVLERLVVFGVLPAQANFDTWKTLKALKNVLTLTEEEKKALNFQVSPDGGRVTWDDKKDVGQEFVISGEGLRLIQDGFRKLDTQSQLTSEQADVMERFKNLKAEV